MLRKCKKGSQIFVKSEGFTKFDIHLLVASQERENDEDKIELAHNAGELLAIAENTLELTKQNKFYQLFEDGKAVKK